MNKSELMKAARLSCSLTQKEFATFLDIDLERYQQIEEGQSPSFEEIKTCALFLGLEVKEFLSGKEGLTAPFYRQMIEFLEGKNG